MAEENDLARRVHALEDQSREMRAQIAAAATEVRAEMRAHTSALNSLRETQLEQGRMLNEHGRILGEHSLILNEHSRILGGHSTTLDNHGQMLVNVQQGVDTIIGLLTEQERPPE